MKATFYGHFVAGEDQPAIQPLVHRLNRYGVGAILDYSVEEDISHSTAVDAEMEWDDEIQFVCPIGPALVDKPSKSFLLSGHNRAAYHYDFAVIITFFSTKLRHYDFSA